MSDNRLKAYVAIKQNGLCPKRQIVCHCYIAVLKRDSFQSILCILLTQSEWEVVKVKLHSSVTCNCHYKCYFVLQYFLSLMFAIEHTSKISNQTYYF